MCRTKVDGGRRCSMSATVNARRTLVQRHKRHVEAGRVDLAADDAAALARLDAARAHYGDIVAPMNMEFPDSVHRVFDTIAGAGFRSLVMGGSVRDSLFDGRTPKDIDVEVYGATVDEVITVLRSARYRVDEVGRQFGVLKVALPDGTDLDVSVPRRDNHVGAGHRGFTVETETDMTAAEAAARRDYTINAMGYDPEFKVRVDPYHGAEDLAAGVLRHPASPEAFAEDPLRVVRGFQFAARYNLALDPETAQVCRDLIPRAPELATERIQGEFAKFYCQGRTPSHGLSVLADMGWDTTVPGLAEANTPVTRRNVDHAATVADEAGLGRRERIQLMSATVARSMPDEQAREFINRTVLGGDEQREAYGLSRAAWRPSLVESEDNEIRRHAHLLGDKRTTLRQWARLETATGVPPTASSVLAAAERLGCADGPQPDLIAGRDIIARFTGRRPGPWTGRVQREARQAQVFGLFTDRAGAQAWLAAQPDPD